MTGVFRAYAPHDWFWIVGGDESRAWSSAARAYVTEWPSDRLSRIESEASLAEVLVNAGYIDRAPLTMSVVQVGIEQHIEATAKARQYSSAVSCASYAASNNPAWQAEALAFIAWRDAVWVYAFAELAKVQNEEREPPASVEAFIAELPDMVWP